MEIMAPDYMEIFAPKYCDFSLPALNRLSRLGLEGIILNAGSDNCYCRIKTVPAEFGWDEKGFLIDTTC